MTMATNKEIARSRFTLKEDENVWLFDDGKSWMEWDHDGAYHYPIYRVHTDIDDKDVSFFVSTEGVLNTEDKDQFTMAAEILDKFASGWRPVNW